MPPIQDWSMRWGLVYVESKSRPFTNNNQSLNFLMTLPIFVFILMVVLKVVEINDSVAMLRKKLEEAEEAKTVLLQARKSLRQDIRFPSLSVFDNLPFKSLEGRNGFWFQTTLRENCWGDITLISLFNNYDFNHLEIIAMMIYDSDDQDQGDVVEDRRRKMPRSKIEVPLQPAVWEGLLF